MDAGRVSVLKTGPEGKRVQGVDGLTFPPPQDTIELFPKLYPLPCYCSDFPGILAGRPGCGAWHNRTQQEVFPMKQFKFPHIGMRTTKTAVAVMLSYLIFVPFGLLYNESYPGCWPMWAPPIPASPASCACRAPWSRPSRLGSPALWGCSSVPSWGWLCCSWSPCCPTGWASS